MPTEKQIDAAAAAAAERANGGKFNDPLFYKPEQKDFWRDVVCTVLEAAEAARVGGDQTPSSVSEKDVQNFSDHCVYIRSVWLFAARILRDSDEEERKAYQVIAPSIFADLDQVLAEYVILAASRVTDPAVDTRKNKNFTVEMFANGFSSDPETQKLLDALRERMWKLRKKIEPARHKLVAHADCETIRSGKAIGGASWAEWDEFWSALSDFVRLLNEKSFGKPFEIDAGGVIGDAENLLKALKESGYFKTLMESSNPDIRDACVNLTLPKT